MSITLLSAAGLAATAGAGHGQKPSERWTATPELRIGDPDARNYSLTEVSDIVVAPDGTVYIVQPKEQLIRAYDQRGRFLRTIGRRGKGPGEFEHPAGIGLVGDTLWVRDPALGRLSLFTRDGKVIRSLRLPPSSSGAILADGSVLVQERIRTQLAATGVLTAVPLVRLDQSGQVLDTLRWNSVRNLYFSLQGKDPVWALTLPQPYADSPLFEVHPDGTGIVVVERPAAQREDRARFTLTRLGPAGDTVFSRTYRYKPLRLSDATVNAFAADLESRIQAEMEQAQAQQVHIPRKAISSDRIRSALYRPEFRPPVTGLRLGRDGTIWLKREEVGRDTDTWTVISPRGDVLASIDLPRNLRVLQVQSDRLWGVEHDEMNVPYVVRYRVRPVSR